MIAPSFWYVETVLLTSGPTKARNKPPMSTGTLMPDPAGANQLQRALRMRKRRLHLARRGGSAGYVRRECTSRLVSDSAMMESRANG